MTCFALDIDIVTKYNKSLAFFLLSPFPISLSMGKFATAIYLLTLNVDELDLQLLFNLQTYRTDDALNSSSVMFGVSEFTEQSCFMFLYKNLI